MSGWAGSSDANGAIPGDPDDLRARARNYDVLADRLEQAGRDMRGQAIPNWQGQGADGYEAFRQRGSQNYFTAAQAARDNAALLTARAQSIEDNRRIVDDASTMRANSTDAMHGQPEEGPLWQTHLDTLQHADDQIAAAQAADAESASRTAMQAAALHQQLPATRLLADSSPMGEFDLTPPPAAPAAPAPVIIPDLPPPAAEPHSIPAPRAAPAPDLGSGPGGGGTAPGPGRTGAGGGDAGGGSSDGAVPAPPSGGKGDGSTGTKSGPESDAGPPSDAPTPSAGPAGSGAPTTNPAALTPTTNPPPSPDTAAPNLPSTGLGSGPAGLEGPGALPAAVSPYTRLGSPYNPLPGQISSALEPGRPPLAPLEPPVGGAPGPGAPSTPGATPPGGAPPAGGEVGGAPAHPEAPLGGSGSGGIGEAPRVPPVPGDPPPIAPPVPAGPDLGGDGGSIGSPPGSGQPAPTVPPDSGDTSPGAPPDAGTSPGSPTGSPSPGRRSGSAAPAGHYGVIVAAGLALAGGVVALLLRARGKMEARQRSRYRAGSGRRDVLPTPPAVRSMARAHHTNPHRDHLDHYVDHPTRPPAHGPATPDATSDATSTDGSDVPAGPDAGPGPAPRREPLARPMWPVGEHGTQPVVLDLALGAVAFVGTGAADAIRALVVAALTGVAGDTTPGRVIMSTAETAELFGFDHTPLPEGAIITADQAASLTVATTLTTHTAGDPLDDGPVLLVINTMRGAQLEATRSTLARLTAAGIGVLILGDHPEGALCDINSDHIVTAAYGPAAEHLHGAKMFELTLEHFEGTLSPLSADPHRSSTHWLARTLADAGAGTGPDGVAADLDTADLDAADPEGADRVGEDSDGAPDTVTDLQAAISELDTLESDLTGAGVAGEGPAVDQPPAAGPRVAWHEGLIREIGIRNNLPLPYDLGAFAGLGLTGPGAPAALRALWFRLSDPTHADPSITPAEVIVPIDTADALLGEPEPNPDADRPGEDPLLAWPGEVADLDTALDRLETEIITRASTHYATTDTAAPSLSPPSASDSSTSSPPSVRGDVAPIVLITHSPEDLAGSHPDPDPGLESGPGSLAGPAAEAASRAGRWASRLAEISERGAALGIAVVVLGHWAHGTNCHLHLDGQVATATGPGGFILRDATLHQLDTTSARTAVVHGFLPPPVHGTQADPEPASSEPVTPETGTHKFLEPSSGKTSPTDATDATDYTPPTNTTTTRDHDSHRDSDSVGAGLDDRGEDAPFAEPQPASVDVDTGAAAASAPPSALVPASAPDAGATVADELAPVGSDPQSDFTGTDSHDASAGSVSVDAEPPVSPQAVSQMSGLVAPDTEPIPAAVSRPPRAHELDRVPAEVLLVVLVLGPLAVYARSAPGQPLREITGQLSLTRRLLLAALAASTDPVHADTLLAMCIAVGGPAGGGEEASHRLQSNITRLRGALRKATGHDTAVKLIGYTAGRYHFTSACWVDHHILHAQLRTASTTVDEPHQYVARWAAAFALYRGPLLDGLEYDVDTEWLAPHREHTLRTMIDLARQLAEHLTPTHPAQAASYLSTALQMDPHNDDTARHLISHHLAHGHRHAAEQVLTQLTRNLAEIGATPQPRTVALLGDTTRPDPTP